MANEFRHVQSSVVMPDLMDTLALATACNEDRRFLEAGWAETPVSIEGLLLSQGFRDALTKLMPTGARLFLGTVVANAYRCRLAERGAPKGNGARKTPR